MSTVRDFSHPLAIEKLIEFAISGKQLNGKDISFHNERWHCVMMCIRFE
jgi:hypothetical protein